MHKFLSKRFNLKKATHFAIIINALQILCALGILIHALFSDSFSIPEHAEIVLVAAAAAIVIWGAVVDIRDAYITRQVEVQRQMLEDAYLQMEALNNALRAQRHDFKNHLQVVYSLTEMNAGEDVLDYVRRVYSDVHSLGQYLRTSVPAVNALLSAKAADCEERGVAFEIDIQSAWEDISVPGWELCRIIGNLVDNAVDALKREKQPEIRVVIGEDIHAWKLQIENNGERIPDEHRQNILLQGFSTKGEGRGNGLSIVCTLLKKHDGELSFTSDSEKTCFICKIRKPGAKTPV